MIIRQTISIARRLLAGAMLGAVVFGMLKARHAAARRDTPRDEPLEPRMPPPQPAGED